MCGILSNGSDFLLINRHYNNGSSRWSSCGPCNRFANLDQVTALLLEYFIVLGALTSTVVAYQDSLAYATCDDDGSDAECDEEGSAGGGAGGGGDREGSAGNDAGSDAGGAGGSPTGSGSGGGGAAVSRDDKCDGTKRHSATSGWSTNNSLTLVNLRKHDQALVWKSVCSY